MTGISPHPSTLPEAHSDPPEIRATVTTVAGASLARSALPVVIILAGAFVCAPYAFYLAFQSRAWQQFAAAAVILSLGLAAVASLWLIRRGRSAKRSTRTGSGLSILGHSGPLIFGHDGPAKWAVCE